MAERSLVEILLRARGAREVYESGKLASRGINDIGRSIARTNERSKLLRHGLYGIGAAGATMGVLLYEGAKKSVEAYAEFQGAAAQVDRQIEHTGHSANVTSKHVEGLANKLSLTAGIADKFSILGGESLLLTFKNIRNEGTGASNLFDRTSKAAVDMTAALRAAGKATTPQQAFMALGRAVSNPAKAAQYLRRALVVLTPAEDAHIKRLVVLNKTTQAQEAVLAAVEAKYQGAAKTAGHTLPGSLGRLHVAMMNIKEDIGYGLAPEVSVLADDLMRIDKAAGPAFHKLGEDLHRTLSRKDLSLGQQLQLSAKDVEKDLGPLADHARQALKRAHLGTKLEHAVEDAAPYIAQGMAHAGVGAATAFAHAWWDSDIWGKTFTTAFLLHKFGAFGKVAQLLAGRGGGVGGAVSKLAPMPVYVTNWEGMGGGFSRRFPSTVAKDAEEAAKTGAGAGLLGAGAPAIAGLAGAGAIYGLGKLGSIFYHSATAGDVGRLNRSLGLMPGTRDPRTGHIHPLIDTTGLSGTSATARGQTPRRYGVWMPNRTFDPTLGQAGGDPRGVFRGGVAFPVLRARATLHNVILLDKVKIADSTKQVELTYGAGGRG